MNEIRKDDRPLTARSVLASTLLGTNPPELPVARLVAVAALFGINENRCRVALSRMAAAGEVVANRGHYRLAGHLLDRFAGQQASRHVPPASWDGSWVVLAVHASRRDASARAEARRVLRAARLAELREGVWLRPANLAVHLPDPLGASVTRFRARPDGDAAALAASLWDLGEWASGARALLQRLRATRADLVPGDPGVLAPGFVLSASVLRHLRADPLLPPPLLPLDWPGQELRDVYDGWDAAYRAVLRQYHRTVSS